RPEESEGQSEMAAEEGAMSPTRMLAEGHLRVATGGGAPADGGIAVRHLPHHHPTKKDNVGGKTEKDNHEGVNSLLSEELEKLANGNSKLVVPIIEEYFSTGDVELAASELNEGFMMLLESTEDLTVDIPDATDVLAKKQKNEDIDEAFSCKLLDHLDIPSAKDGLMLLLGFVMLLQAVIDEHLGPAAGVFPIPSLLMLPYTGGFHFVSGYEMYAATFKESLANQQKVSWIYFSTVINLVSP
ncbi:hypothetical protein ACJX0J_011825, partial [Zea mays]